MERVTSNNRLETRRWGNHTMSRKYMKSIVQLGMFELAIVVGLPREWRVGEEKSFPPSRATNNSDAGDSYGLHSHKQTRFTSTHSFSLSFRLPLVLHLSRVCALFLLLSSCAQLVWRSVSYIRTLTHSHTRETDTIPTQQKDKTGYKHTQRVPPPIHLVFSPSFPSYPL